MNPRASAELRAIEAMSRRGAYMAILGVALLASAAVGATFYASKLSDTITDRKKTIAELEERTSTLRSNIEHLAATAATLTRQKESLADRAGSLETALNATLSDRVDEGSARSTTVTTAAPPSVAPRPPSEAPTVTSLDSAEPLKLGATLRAEVTKLKDQFTVLPGTKSQLYSIDLWLEGSADDLGKLKRVTYSLSRYYRVKPQLISTTAASGFRVTTVPLWGCVGTVLVVLEGQAGDKQNLVFDWCRAANWDRREL